MRRAMRPRIDNRSMTGSVSAVLVVSAAAFEKVEQARLAARTVEHVILFDAHHRLAAAFRGQRVARAGHLLFLHQHAFLRDLPFIERDDRWHRLHGLAEAYWGRLQLTIQCAPKRSVNMPKRNDQAVSPMGIITSPPVLSALNARSASSGVSTTRQIRLPWIPGYGAPSPGGHQSEPINCAPPTSR